MELKDTIQGMVSNDFKERIKAELLQLAIRIKKAEIYINGVKHDQRNTKDYILGKQVDAMKEYYEALRARAQLFEIDTDEADREKDLLI